MSIHYCVHPRRSTDPECGSDDSVPVHVSLSAARARTPHRAEHAFALFYTGTIGSGAISPVLDGMLGDALGATMATAATALIALAIIALASCLLDISQRMRPRTPRRDRLNVVAPLIGAAPHAQCTDHRRVVFSTRWYQSCFSCMVSTLRISIHDVRRFIELTFRQRTTWPRKQRRQRRPRRQPPRKWQRRLPRRRSNLACDEQIAAFRSPTRSLARLGH
jgi:hypothetical protein